MLTFFGLVVCGYLVLVTGLYLGQRRLLYLPDRSIPSRTASGVPEMSEVRLQTDDGFDLLAWYRPAAPRRATIVYLHGNGGHIGFVCLYPYIAPEAEYLGRYFRLKSIDDGQRNDHHRNAQRRSNNGKPGNKAGKGTSSLENQSFCYETG